MACEELGSALKWDLVGIRGRGLGFGLLTLGRDKKNDTTS